MLNKKRERKEKQKTKRESENKKSKEEKTFEEVINLIEEEDCNKIKNEKGINCPKNYNHDDIITNNNIIIENKSVIKLTIGDSVEEFNTITYNLEKSAQLYEEFLIIKNDELVSDEVKFKKISEVIELNEINSQYNFYYLKYCAKCLNSDNISYYLKDKEILDITLNNEDFFKLYNKPQENPALDIYEFLISEDKKLFKEKFNNSKFNNLNIPLIRATERIRLNLYKFNLFKSNQDFNEFNNIILKMKKYFENIDPDEKEFNIKTYLFLLCLLAIKTNKKKCKTWYYNYVSQTLSPLDQLNKEVMIDNYVLYPNNIINDGNSPTIIVKDSKKNEFLISNNFEKKIINSNDYCIKNLIKDITKYEDIPLDILLKRNESFDFFKKQKRNIIDDDYILKEFKVYFYKFIKSKLIKEVLQEEHKNIIELIESECFTGFKLDEEYVKSIPLFSLIGEGYTDKDCIVSFISYFPIIIEEYGDIDTLEKYNNIIIVFFYFEICYKFIVCLHEVIIHLSYGYLNYVTEGKIQSKSPKASKKSQNSDEHKDGGSYFEKLLFGEKIKNINMQLIYCLLNGQHFDDSVEKFRQNLLLKFEPKGIKKTGLFGKLMDKYKINFDLFRYNSTYGNMRHASRNIFAKRGITIKDMSHEEVKRVYRNQ